METEIPYIEEIPNSNSRRWLYIILLILLLFFVVSLVLWLIWFKGMSFSSFVILELQTMFNIAMWPIKFLLRTLGLWPGDGGDSATPFPINANITTTEIVKHELSECPPCNCKCECPECEKIDVKPYEMEIQYLKDMVRLVGSIAKRENAINAQYKELYPGFSVMSPHVIKLTTEYQLIKDGLRNDEDEWNYFKNYFSKLSGIPSAQQTSQPPVYDDDLNI